MSHHNDDWDDDSVLALVLAGEGRGWWLVLSTCAVLALLAYHYWG